MLVDISPLYDTPEKIAALTPEQQKLWAEFTEEERSYLIPRRLGPGVWDGGLNPTHIVDDSNLHEFVESMGNLRQTVEDKRDAWTIYKESGHLSSYGVCDGIDNLRLHPDYLDILNGPRKFTVFITEVRRADQPEDGGWRWHKWGPYIGSYEPQHEYIYDEAIDSVWLFNIVEHRS